MRSHWAGVVASAIFATGAWTSAAAQDGEAGGEAGSVEAEIPAAPDAAVHSAAPAGVALSYTIVDGVAIADPLAAEPGDPGRGRAIFEREGEASCVTCHTVGPLDDAAEAAALISLEGVGARLSRGALRLWIANPRALRDAPGMPAYFSLYPNGDEPDPARSPLLSAVEIEDLVAYLNGLSVGAAPTAAED